MVQLAHNGQQTNQIKDQKKKLKQEKKFKKKDNKNCTKKSLFKNN